MCAANSNTTRASSKPICALAGMALHGLAQRHSDKRMRVRSAVFVARIAAQILRCAVDGPVSDLHGRRVRHSPDHGLK